MTFSQTKKMSYGEFLLKTNENDFKNCNFFRVFVALIKKSVQTDEELGTNGKRIFIKLNGLHQIVKVPKGF